MFKQVFLLLLLFSLAVVSDANSDDLYNTKAATSDLRWNTYPSQNGWEEVTSLDREGRAVRSYQVCNLEQNDNSWIRTPFIPSKGAKRAYIDVEFSMRKCDDLKSGCRETFNMYYFEANTDRASSTFPPWRENPYIKIDTIAADERFGSSNVGRAEGVNFKTWTLGPLTLNGFYIAAQDQGACMSILSLRVYYFYCPKVVKGLATFSRTVSGNGTASLDYVEGVCVPNANITTPYGPRYHCNSNGEWKVQTGLCYCNPGFQANEDLTACTACNANHYKSLSGNQNCTVCPSKSGSSSKKILDYCRCHTGYFRASNDDVHQPCTKPPSAPEKIRSVINVTSVFLSWQQPIINGGRSDLYYNVSCYKCKGGSNGTACSPCPNDVTFFPVNHMHLLETNCKVQNLQPFTNYKFKVFAMNGVTSLSRAPPAYKAVSVVTKEGVPSPVESIKVIWNLRENLTLVWLPPEPTNGRIIKYQLTWVDKAVSRKEINPSNVYESHDLETVENIAVIPDVIPGHTYTIWVRAATTTGYGKYSKGFDVLATQKNDEKQSITAVILIGVVALIVLLFFATLLLYHCFKKQGWIFSKKKDPDTDSEETIALHTSADLVVNLPPDVDKNHRIYVDYPDPYRAIKEFSCEILPSQLKIGDIIGQGEFGEVCRGVLHADDATFDVAVKKLKRENTDRDNFLREASTMAQFSHPNIILLKGVITKSFPFMIITEYMENGSLKSFLEKKNSELTVVQLLEMLKGIASGMQYLSSMKYVHRDLAARNILVDSNLVCKVSDFGLSRTLENDPHATYTTQGGKIAIRWTAPESIRSRKFTSASDVWSYGIVMWEVMSYGEKPYWNMTNPEVLQSLDKGYRLPAPSGCPISLHRLMVDCWAFDAQVRPTIDDVHRRISALLQRPQSLTHVVQSHKTPKTGTDVAAA